MGHPFAFTADANTLLPLVSFIQNRIFKKSDEKFCATLLEAPLPACHGAPCMRLGKLPCSVRGCTLLREEGAAEMAVNPQKASNSAGEVFVRIASSRKICVRKAIGGIESNRGLAA